MTVVSPTWLCDCDLVGIPSIVLFVGDSGFRLGIIERLYATHNKRLSFAELWIFCRIINPRRSVTMSLTFNRLNQAMFTIIVLRG